jgi:hypothetical protein
VKGIAEGLKYVQSLCDVEAMVVDGNGEIHTTAGGRAVFELKN